MHITHHEINNVNQAKNMQVMHFENKYAKITQNLRNVPGNELFFPPNYAKITEITQITQKLRRHQKIKQFTHSRTTHIADEWPGQGVKMINQYTSSGSYHK